LQTFNGYSIYIRDFLESVFVKSDLLIVTLVLISVLASSFAQATPVKSQSIVYYVSTTGNNDNDGVEEKG